MAKPLTEEEKALRAQRLAEEQESKSVPSKAKTIYEKLSFVQLTLKAPKNQFNSFGKYHYRSCEDIMEGLKEPLKAVNASVVIGDEIVEIAGRVYVKATARFMTDDGYIENVAYAREPETKSGMDQAQITGATSSYARKYALNGLFLIDDNKDADTNESKIEQDSKANKTQSKQPTQRQMQDVGGQFISETKQKSLYKKCEEDGINPAFVCEKLNVSDFSKITEKNLAWICQNWSKVIINGIQS